MPNKDPKVEEKAGLFLIDPNPPGRGTIPTEDMFIYVKFTATPRSRGVYNLTSTDNSLDESNIGEINFIATEVKYDASGAPIKNLMGKTESYATTNYTDIGGVKNTYSNGSLEGFGIRSINIKYSSSLVPEVDISFTDIRGSALFDIISEDNRKSPYSIFFKMPYPIFTLTVKGYFGKPVDYCLHMVNWNSKFDPSTGNFDIDAKFLGFQQAFLADITIGNIIGVNNTEEGRAALSKLKLKSSKTPEGVLLDTPPLDEFIKKIGRLQVDVDVLKTTIPEYNEIVKINTQREKIKRIQKFIGRPIKKDPIDQTSGKKLSTEDFESQYELLPNDPRQIKTDPLPKEIDGLELGVDYLSIRDILIFKVSTFDVVNDYISFLYSDLLLNYLVFKNDPANKEILTNIIDGIVVSKGDGYTFDSPFDSITMAGGKIRYLDGLQFKFATGNPLNVNSLDTSKPKNITTISDALDQIRNILGNEGGKNNNFDTSLIKDKDFIGPGKFNSQDVVFALKFDEMRSIVNSMVFYINVIKKEKQKEVNKIINEKLKKSLGFNPTVRTVFEIICNNTQALLQSTYDIASKVNTSLSKSRGVELTNAYNIETDIDTEYQSDFRSSTIYPFPKILVEESGELIEKYIGSEELKEKGITEQSFPEITYINNVTSGIVEKSAALDANRRTTLNTALTGSDTNTWVPINPIDFEENPFFKFNSNVILDEGEEGIKEEIRKVILTRFAISKNYSKMVDTDLSAFGEFDGTFANKFIDEPTIRKMLTVYFDETSATKLKSQAEQDGFLIDNKINEGTDPEIGDIMVGGYRNNDIEYIFLDERDMYNKGLNLFTEVTSTSSYKRIFIQDTKPTDYTRGFQTGLPINSTWKNHIKLQNISYGVWGEDINSKFKKEITTNESTFSFDDISIIDGGLSQDETNSVGASTKTNYINIFRRSNTSQSSQPTQQPLLLTDTDLYVAQQTNAPSKVLLLLNTLPFQPFEDTVLKIFDGTVGARVIRIPEHYLLWVCGTLWRATQTTDPIVWNNTEITPPIPLNQYLYDIGDPSLKLYDSGTIISDKLINLPDKTKETLIDYFIKYAESNSEKLEDLFVKYTNVEQTTDEKDMSARNLVKHLSFYSDFIVAAPDILESNGLNSGLSVEGFDAYYNRFREKFQSSEIEQDKKTKIDAENNDKQLETIKLSVYNYFKNVYDKWIAGTEKDKLCFNACTNNTIPLIDYFRFIDRAFNDIGDDAVINLNSVATLSENLNTSVYFYISKILRDSNFLLQIIPSYINFKDPDEVRDMFKPITNISDRNSSSGPTYLCVYVGGSSEVLDLDEKSRYSYKNDSFSLFDNPTVDFTGNKTDSNNKQFNLVAFRVAYGAENQTFFKSVALNQQEHRETAEYFAALSDLIDKKGGTQRTYQGTDLYRMFRTRSYTCVVESLGCMNIQPMMYFQLDNVPFFHGAYMILSVTHNITPNHMTTTFTGLRQSKIISKPVEEVTTFLGIGLDETDEISEPNIDKLSNKTYDPYTIGIDPNDNPDEQFFGDRQDVTSGELPDITTQIPPNNGNN